MDAYAMAATVDFGLEAKQGLLDLRSENARLRLVSAAVPRRAQAAGLRRPRPGAGEVKRQGQIRVTRRSGVRRPAGSNSRARSMASGTSTPKRPATRRSLGRVVDG